MGQKYEIGRRATTRDPKQLFDECIAYIRHENDLINHRTTWLLSIQGALVAAFGILFVSRFEPLILFLAEDFNADPHKWVGHAISAASFLFLAVTGDQVCRFGHISIRAANMAQQRISTYWIEQTSDAERLGFLDMRGGKRKDPIHVNRGPVFALAIAARLRIFWWLAGAVSLLCTAILAEEILRADCPSQSAATATRPSQNTSN